MDDENTSAGASFAENQKENASRWKKAAIVLSTLAATLVLLAAGTGLFIWYSGSVHGSMFTARSGKMTESAQPVQTAAPLETEKPIDADWIDEEGNAYNYRDDMISVLLMGVDYMSEKSHWENGMISNGGNSDVLALVILNTTTFDFSILYIPRDTMADVLATDEAGNYIDTVYTNISTAHSYGDGKEVSCELTADAVSRLLFSVPITRYAALKFDAIYKISDILGGLTITFDKDYSNINPSYTEGTTVTMSGWQLQRFIVYRDKSQTESAYERGVRDMLVLKAMFDQCKNKIAEEPTVVLDIMSELGSYLTTNLDVREISYLAQNIGKMDFSSDTVIKLPGEVRMGETYAEFYPDKDWLHDFVANTFCEKIS